MNKVFTHTGIIHKDGKRRVRLYKAQVNWHADNKLIFSPTTGVQRNGNRRGYLDLTTLEKI